MIIEWQLLKKAFQLGDSDACLYAKRVDFLHVVNMLVFKKWRDVLSQHLNILDLYFLIT